jgi:hypothetical protein
VFATASKRGYRRKADEGIPWKGYFAGTKRREAGLCLANCYEGRYYRQIAPRKGDASPFLNGLGDSETIGAAKRYCNQERTHRMISFQVFAGLTGYHSEPEYLKS